MKQLRQRWLISVHQLNLS